MQVGTIDLRTLLTADPLGYRVVRLAFNPASGAILAVMAATEATTSRRRLFRRTLADPAYEEILAPSDACEFADVLVCESAALAFASVRTITPSVEYVLYALDLLHGNALVEVPPPHDSSGERLWLADLLSASHDGSCIYLTVGTQSTGNDGSVSINYFVARMTASTGEIVRLARLASPYS